MNALKKYILFSILITAVGSISFIGCSSEKNDSLNLDGLIPWQYFEGASVKDIIEKAKVNSKVVCDQSNDCPEAAAYLIVAQKTSSGVGVGQCSGFLVGEDIIGTNSHCVVAGQRNKDFACKNILVFFPNTKKYGNEMYECEKIIDASEISVIESRGIYDPNRSLPQDYAFLKLTKKTTRTPLKISYDGFVDGESIAIYATNPDHHPTTDYGFTGTLKPRRCNTKYNFSDPLYQNPKHPLVVYNGCDIIPGTSGSGILTVSDGTVRGINQGKQSSGVGEFGTNLACVNDPVFGTRSLDSHCGDGT